MKTILRSRELSCPSCVAKIEKGLQGLNGVQAAKVHFNTGRIEVEYDDQSVDTQALIKTIRDLGYDAAVSTF